MNITEIYNKYKIPPNLQLHMMRVAALADLISSNWTGSSIDREKIINACLLHDMGNILKFDFDNFPELLGDEIVRLEYWRDVKKEMAKKYGADEDLATMKIVKEIGVENDVEFIVENWGFKNFVRINNSDNIEWKIAVYSDHRISPGGVTSLEENLVNKQKRYSFSKKGSSHLSNEADNLLNAAKQIEIFIQKNCRIDLQKIHSSDLVMEYI
jgi:hypothetical protein